MNGDQPVALITGASSGIGLELAKLFARDKNNLVLVARRGDKLSQIAIELNKEFGTSVKTIAADLTRPEAPGAIFEELKEAGIVVEILVNNAGFGQYGTFADVGWEESLGQIQLNITALTHLTKLFLPAMVQRRTGRIMNVASTAGFQAGPGMAVYYATKAFVISFSEALAYELQDTGIKVTCFCPGPTDTGFQSRAQIEESRLFKQVGPMDAKAVARDGYIALTQGKTLAISGFRNWLVAESVRFAPRRMVTAISGWMQQKAG
jgi:uncharacterized protein